MLYELEWLTPHETPMGRTVADWVQGVRWLEENKYLRDPATMTWPADPEHPANQQMALQQKVCPPLCWRTRCKRAQRCVHFMPLAVREFMPELVVHLYNLHNERLDYSGPVNPDKMVILGEIFGKAAKPPANRESRLPLDMALDLTESRNEDDKTETQVRAPA